MRLKSQERGGVVMSKGMREVYDSAHEEMYKYLFELVHGAENSTSWTIGTCRYYY